jgi:hypothetical protein
MLPQSVQRPNSHAPYFDGIEVLMIAAGILIVVAAALMF